MNGRFESFGIIAFAAAVACVAVVQFSGLWAALALTAAGASLILSCKMSDGDPRNDWNVVLILLVLVLVGIILFWMDVRRGGALP